MGLKLIIPDLDETLIFSSKSPVHRDWGFQFEEFWVTPRPHVSDFIDYCNKHFDVAIWSSAGEDYVAEVVRHIIPNPGQLAFVWSHRRCTLHHDHETGELVYLKNLKKIKKLGYELKECLVIDDAPEYHKKNYGNLICVEKYLGDHDDLELKLLIAYLERIRHMESMRSIEKRGWRST